MNYSLRIYYNKFYPSYKSDCYMVYIENLGTYLMNLNDREATLANDQIRFSVNNSNIDTYASSRGFEKVSDFDIENKKASWYGLYAKEENKNKVNRLISKMRSALGQLYKYSTINSKRILDLYAALSVFVYI